MPDERSPQALSMYTRDAVEASAECACFYCLSRFPAADVTEYVDDGRTPLCPGCGIDSVLAASSFGGKLPDRAELEAMRKQSFGLDDRETDGPVKSLFDFFDEPMEEVP